MHRKSVGFKTLTITCLALALISTISLNIIRTYSINNTRTNALGDSSLGSSTATTSQGSAATLANDSNPISISLSNATGSSDPTSGNISITTPTGGGIATGSHTVTIHTSSLVSGYNVTIHSSGGDTDLVPSDFGTSESSNNNLIEPAGGSANPAPLANPTTLANNQWGIALPGSTLYPNKYSNTNDYTSTNQTTLANTKYAAIPGKGSSDDQDSTILTKNSPANQATGDSTTIYYGVKVSPSIQADTYSAEVTYTATAIIPTPTLTRLLINDSVQQNQTSEFAIEGTNLDTVYDVWIDYNDNGMEDANEKATNVTTYSNTNKASTIISFTNPNPTSNTVSPGAYDVYAVGQGGTSKPLTNAFIVQEESICRNGDPNSDCQVDIDDNMIPIVWDDSGNVQPTREDNANWYDYGNKRWANAVTINRAWTNGSPTDPSQHYCYDQMTGSSIYLSGMNCAYSHATELQWYDVVDAFRGTGPYAYYSMDELSRAQMFKDFEANILGYWVYIPRYAYEVQRPNAIDRVVADEYELPDGSKIVNEFTIHFEKATDSKKSPKATCNVLSPTAIQMWKDGNKIASADAFNENILAKDYRTQCPSTTRLYNNIGSNTSSSSWATHPAFTFGSMELNGLWVGKFETTGKVNAPTVKPNQHANVGEYIGEFYTMARSIGVGTYDPTNNGGNTISRITQNSHNLNKATSHMLKNSEWGAITYLASSKYGAGTNNVSINSAYPSKSADADGYSSKYGITGCGPNNIDRSTTAYSSVTTSTGETVKLPALSSSHIEDLLACGDVEHSYIGKIGQLASTTNNVYGIYDMSGGASEYVMGNFTSSNTETTSYDTTEMQNQAKPPYVDLYKESSGFGTTDSGGTIPAWSSMPTSPYYNIDVCAWDTCGGHAIHETMRFQSPSNRDSSWGSNYSQFSGWSLRGGNASFNSYSGLFFLDGPNGTVVPTNGFRVVLMTW